LPLCYKGYFLLSVLKTFKKEGFHQKNNLPSMSWKSVERICCRLECFCHKITKTSAVSHGEKLLSMVRKVKKEMLTDVLVICPIL
jgi:hypothetical protein